MHRELQERVRGPGIQPQSPFSEAQEGKSRGSSYNVGESYSPGRGKGSTNLSFSRTVDQKVSDKGGVNSRPVPMEDLTKQRREAKRSVPNADDPETRHKVLMIKISFVHPSVPPLQQGENFHERPWLCLTERAALRRPLPGTHRERYPKKTFFPRT